MQTPRRFKAAIFFNTEGLNCCFSSHSLMCGATSFCANSLTVCTSALWSSVNSKSIISLTLFNQVVKMTAHLTESTFQCPKRPNTDVASGRMGEGRRGEWARGRRGEWARGDAE